MIPTKLGHLTTYSGTAVLTCSCIPAFYAFSKLRRSVFTRYYIICCRIAKVSRSCSRCIRPFNLSIGALLLIHWSLIALEMYYVIFQNFRLIECGILLVFHLQNDFLNWYRLLLIMRTTWRLSSISIHLFNKLTQTYHIKFSGIDIRICHSSSLASMEGTSLIWWVTEFLRNIVKRSSGSNGCICSKRCLTPSERWLVFLLLSCYVGLLHWRRFVFLQNYVFWLVKVFLQEFLSLLKFHTRHF